jgi:hypothetical protein
MSILTIESIFLNVCTPSIILVFDLYPRRDGETIVINTINSVVVVIEFEVNHEMELSKFDES